MYLLDSNTLIYLFKRQGRVRERMGTVADDAISIPAIAAYELEVGAIKSSRPEAQIEQMSAALDRFHLRPFDLACARHAAQTRAHLERAGTPIGTCDLLIAGTALAHNLVVVTRNVREFARVPGLRVENWYD